ncbi:MAG: FIVAR domain-containing protein [Oscillospiraceae bacterium]|jgi:hypothetical protein|nr:FIVAR domain-containing protein [Oscillospiraceae bacterium]
MFKNLFRPKRNRVIAAVLAAVLAITTLAIGLSGTFGAKPDVDVTLTQPNSYVAVEKGSFYDRDIVGAYRVSSGNTAIATASISGATVRVTGVSAGTVTISVGSSAGLALAVNYQVTDSGKINAYKIKNNGEVFLSAPGKNAASPVTTTPTAAFSTITWSSLQTNVATVAANGVITAVGKGAAIILGTFTDKWGVKQDLHILVGVGITLGDDLLSDLLEWIKKGEVILGLDDNPYTSDTLSDLQDAVNNGKAVLDLANPTDKQLEDAIDEIKDAIDGLVKKIVTPDDVFDDGNGNYYRPVGDPKNVYLVVKPDGTPKHQPPEYVYDRDADGDSDPTTGGALEKAYPNNGLYYVEDPAGSNIYKQVNSNGTLKNSPAIWGGPDGQFGGGDDQTVVNYGATGTEYYVDMGQNVFRKVQSPLVLGPLVGGGDDEDPSTLPVTLIYDNTAIDGKYYVGPLGPDSDGNAFYYGDKVTGGDGLLNSSATAKHGTDDVYYKNADGSMTTTKPEPPLPEIPGLDSGSSTITVDGVEWIVLKRTTVDGKKYALLLRKVDAGTVGAFSATSNNYEGSAVQSACTVRFTTAYFTPALLQQHAVVPTLGSHASTTADSAPTAVLASSIGQTKDIEFALSYHEADTLMNETARAAFGHRWYLRTASTTTDNVWYVLHTGGLHYEYFGIGTLNNVYLHPALWVTY